MVKYWIGVVSKEHVLNGVSNQIAQIGHGKISGLNRMKKGDWLIYYSPKISLESKEKLQCFTALGQVADDSAYQVDISDTFKPWRRNINYYPTKEIPIFPLIDKLQFIKDTKHWGYVFRFGLIEISLHDFKLIKQLMIKI